MSCLFAATQTTARCVRPDQRRRRDLTPDWWPDPKLPLNWQPGFSQIKQAASASAPASVFYLISALFCPLSSLFCLLRGRNARAIGGDDCDEHGDTHTCCVVLCCLACWPNLDRNWKLERRKPVEVQLFVPKVLLEPLSISLYLSSAIRRHIERLTELDDELPLPVASLLCHHNNQSCCLLVCSVCPKVVVFFVRCRCSFART